MRNAERSDIVLVNGQKARVTDAAIEDDLIRVAYLDSDKTEFVMQSQVEWNYTAIHQATLDIDFDKG